MYLSPTSDESRPLIGQLARVYDLVCRGKSCMSGLASNITMLGRHRGTSDIQDWSRIADQFIPQLLDIKYRFKNNFSPIKCVIGRR